MEYAVSVKIDDFPVADYEEIVPAEPLRSGTNDHVIVETERGTIRVYVDGSVILFKADAQEGRYLK